MPSKLSLFNTVYRFRRRPRPPAKSSSAIIGKCLGNFFLSVHDERSVFSDAGSAIGCPSSRSNIAPLYLQLLESLEWLPKRALRDSLLGLLQRSPHPERRKALYLFPRLSGGQRVGGARLHLNASDPDAVAFSTCPTRMVAAAVVRSRKWFRRRP